ncbi:MAG: cyclase family protein [Lachnospiraceae bacterium]|nr:cyclase family protein [Lachnospiraceae bacterium]
MKKMLSYPLKKGNPTWPGNPTIDWTPHTSIAGGDVANTGTIHLFNHYGTHIDGPLHFCPNGTPLCDFSIDHFIFGKPLVIDLPKNAGEKIEPSDLAAYAGIMQNADLVLFRTGFQAMRSENPSEYEENGPAVSSACAEYLQDHFPDLRAIALDFVSLASYRDSIDGDRAHQYMLGMHHEHCIFIIEDVNMKELPCGFLNKVYAVPLYIEQIDSSPVTMWAEL